MDASSDGQHHAQLATNSPSVDSRLCFRKICGRPAIRRQPPHAGQLTQIFFYN
jgi:hypothetical protein